MTHHLRYECPREIIDCPNQGRSVFQEGCSKKFQRQHMPKHLIECEYRKVVCPNHGCGKQIIFKDKALHESTCPFTQLKCKNRCDAVVKRKNMEEHLAVCPYQLVKCPYYEFGCNVEYIRAKHEEHLKEEAFRHSILFIEGQKVKNQEITELKSQVSLLKKDYDVEMKSMFLELNKVKEELTKMRQSKPDDE